MNSLELHIVQAVGEKSKIVFLRSWVFLFLFTLVFFTNDKYHFKIISFALLMFAYLIHTHGKIKLDPALKRIALSSVGITCALTIISFLSTHNLIISFKGAYYWLFFLVLLPIDYLKLDINDIAIRILKLLIVMIAIFMLLDFIGISSIYDNPVAVFLNDEFALMVKSPQYYTYYKITHKANPLFILLFSYSLYKKEYQWMLDVIFVVMVSYSDVVLAAIILCAGVYCIEKYISGKKKIFFFILVSALCVLLTFVIPFTTDSADMDIRRDLVRETIKLFKNNPSKLIAGFGDKVLIYIPSRESYEEAIEISYVEGLRRYGLLGMIPMLIIILRPLSMLDRKKSSWFIAAFLSYLVMSAVNLFLFSSTAMFMYILAYSMGVRNKHLMNM